MTTDRCGARHRPGATAAMAVASALLALALGGCTLQGDRTVAVATPAASASPPRGAPQPAVKVVRRATAAAEDATAPASGTPSPREIFDFHPPGSRADAWRQPFIIDPNDGPLAGDVRRSAAELRAFLAAPKADLNVAGARRCGETDVATGQPGCVGAASAVRPLPRGAATPPPL